MCTGASPTFDDGSSWSVTHNSGTCNNRAVIHVSAGCGTSGYSIALYRTLEGESEEQIFIDTIPSGPINGYEFSYDEVPDCGRGDVTYEWRILCDAAISANSDPITVEQGGPGTIVSTALSMDENCRITAACRITNTNCGECAGTLKLYRRTGLAPAYDPGEVVFSSSTINSPYSNDDFTYSETLEDGTYFYSWRLINFDGGVDDTSTPASINPECNVYIPTPVENTEVFQKQIVLVRVSGSPENWSYTDIKFLNENEQRLEWFYHKNGGCGSFRFLTHEFLDEHFDDSLAHAWEIHVRIKLVGEYYYTTWFRGVIRSIKEQEQGAETLTEIRGYGYVEMLDNVQVQREYNAGLTVKDVVDDIIANYVVPNTRIIRPYDLDPTNGDLGTDDSPYILDKPLHFECSALKAIKFLAELQGNREFGVDADKLFYFRESVTSVRKNFFVGHDLIDRVAGGKTFGATNKVKVAGKSHGARDLLKVREDVTEIATNGVYETVHEVPWVTGDFDATRWADNIINKFKNTQDWSIFQWQNIDFRVESQHPMGRVQVFGSDMSNDRQSFDVAKIQYIEGGYKGRNEIKEIGRSTFQSSIDQPPLRAIFYVGQYPRDIVEELEIQLREQVEALKGRHKQFRYPNDVTNKTEPGKIPGEIKHFSKDVTNHDITNNPAELQDITNPRGLVMVWIDNQWVKVDIRRTVHTLPNRGKFIGEIISLITDYTNGLYGELRWWSGTEWTQFGTGGGGGGGISLSDATPATIVPDAPGSPGSGVNASREDHTHPIASGTVVDITNANAEGTSVGFARDDHQHRGVLAVRVKGQPEIYGALDITTSGGITAEQDGQTITIRGSAGTGGTTDVVTDVSIEKEQIIKTDSDFSTTSSTGAEVTGTRIDFTLTEETEVTLSVDGTLEHIGGGDLRTDGLLGIKIDGTYYFGGWANTTGLGYAIDYPGGLKITITLAAGSHTAYAALKIGGTASTAIVGCSSTTPLTFEATWLNKTMSSVSGAGGNTASNVGTDGVGVFHQKTGSDLEFRKIAPGSSKVTVTYDVSNTEVEIDVDSEIIPLDTLGEMSDITNLNVNTSRHGLFPKLPTQYDGQAPALDSEDPDGLSWSWFVGPIGLAIFGDGSDGDLTLSGSTVTLSTTTWLKQYDDVEIDTGTLTKTSSNSPYCMVIRCWTLNGNGGSITMPVASASGSAVPQSAGGTGAAGGGSGGTGGRTCDSLWVFAKIITGTGTISAPGTNGSDGANATAATGTANGAAGAGLTLRNFIFGTQCDMTGSMVVAGGGAGAAGTGGAAGTKGSVAFHVDVPQAIVNAGRYAAVGLSSFGNQITGGQTVWSTSGSGGGAGGRNNGGAQGAGGGGGGFGGMSCSGVFGGSGGVGGAGGAGGSGAGGGGGGGGAPGGFCFVYSLYIASGWIIHTDGGNGGNGGNGNGYGGGGATGGGGAGGMTVVYTPYGTDATVRAAGGAAGATVGTPGASGGSAGNLGSDGSDGYVINMAMIGA